MHKKENMLVSNYGGRGASFRAKGGKIRLSLSRGKGNPSEKLPPAYTNRIKGTGNEEK